MIRLKTLIQEWTGERWSSCAHWNSHKSDFLSGSGKAQVILRKSMSGFMVEYEGPGSGVAMSHAKQSGGDTLHQLFNVMVCELNPYLMAHSLKPVLDQFQSTCTVEENRYTFTIQVPLEAAEEPWQINHRGSWSKSDPGESRVKSETPNSKRREGPVRHVSTIPGSNSIYTYLVTYPLADAK